MKKWKRNELDDDDTDPLPLNQRSDSEAFSASSQSFARAVGDGPDTKLIKKKLLHSDGSPSDFFIGFGKQHKEGVVKNPGRT